MLDEKIIRKCMCLFEMLYVTKRLATPKEVTEMISHYGEDNYKEAVKRYEKTLPARKESL